MASLESLQNGRYAIVKKLGEGGKGIVFKARDTVLNRVVAIKALKSTDQGEDAYARFMREAQVVAKLNHPNIVSIYDIGKEGDTRFLVLEFVDGMNLRGLMRTSPEGRCSVETVLRIGMDVCSSLQYAHAQGVLHRDIKPENILITEEGIAKLMDFGLAKMAGQPGITHEGMIVGTVAYVAPEIALGKGADARSDLYSFGAVLYEMVGGRPPFVEEEPMKTIFSHVHDYPVSLTKLDPKVPQALAECIMRLLEKDPGKRYQSAADLLTALRDITESTLTRVTTAPRKPSVTGKESSIRAFGEVQLVDRAEEMEVLQDAVDRTVRREGGLIFLCGEAGIGKTRLTRELGSYARLRGMEVLSGRCPALFRMDGVPPYVLWKEVIRDCLGSRTPEQLYRVIGFYPSEVSKLLPEVRQKLGAFPESPALSPEQERERLFEAVMQFVINVSREAPLLLVLDDLQWADPSSLLLMHYLARSVNREPLLLLGAYRDTDVDEKHPLSPVLTELNRERLLKSIQLKRMSFDDVSETLKRILEQEQVPRQFCELVYEKTRGNPFFVEEVISSLKEEGIIYRGKTGWDIKETSRIEFPNTVKNVIKARISRLDDASQDILTMASFIGNDCTFDALREVMGIEEEKLIEPLEKVLKTGLLKERVIRGEDTYSFADVIVRDVVHEEVSHLRHKRLHRLVGCALEKAYVATIDEHYGELAYHFLESGDRDKALDYFLKAGEKAEKVYAHVEAFAYLQHALELLGERAPSVEERVRVIERLGDLKLWMGETDSCIEYMNKATKLCEHQSDKKNVARLNAKMAHALWHVVGDKDRASEYQRKALEILDNQPESLELADLYEDMAHMLWRGGKSDESLPLAQRAYAMAEKLGGIKVLSSCCVDLMVLSMKSGQHDNALKYGEQGLKMSLEHNFIENAITFYNDLADHYFIRGEFQKCFEMSKNGSEYARKVGAIPGIVWLDFQLAGSYGYMGEIKKAISILDELITLDVRTKNIAHLSYATWGLGLAYLVLGEWDRSNRYLKEALDIAEKVGEYQGAANAHVQLGELYMEMGDYRQAEQHLKEGIKILEDAGDVEGKFSEAIPMLAFVHLRKGEIVEAKEMIDSTYEYAMKSDNGWLMYRCELLKGVLHEKQMNWGESIEHFQKSLLGYKSMGADEWYVYEFANLLHEYGSMYLERNEKGDKDRAYSLLDQALAIYQKIDAKKKIEGTIAKKQFLNA